MRSLGLALAVVGMAAAPAPGSHPVTANLVSADGTPVGHVRVEAASGGVRINLVVHGLRPGSHQVTLRQKGECRGPAFRSAGAIWGAGPLPDLQVQLSGAGDMSALINRATLAQLLDADGAALVVDGAAHDGVARDFFGADSGGACAVLAR